MLRLTICLTGVMMYQIVIVFLLCFNNVASAFSLSSPKKDMRNVGAEEVVNRQLSLLQNGRNIQRAYDECFSFQARVETGGWEIFAEELDTDKAFGPLVHHQSATVVMVIQSPDPNYCQCLVRLVLPKNDTDDDAGYQASKFKIPSYYWFAMKLEESLESDRGILVRSQPGDKAVWKVMGIQPDFESLDFTEEEVMFINDDDNPWNMPDVLDFDFDEDDDDDEAFLAQQFGSPGDVRGGIYIDEDGDYVVGLDNSGDDDSDDEDDDDEDDDDDDYEYGS